MGLQPPNIGAMRTKVQFLQSGAPGANVGGVVTTAFANFLTPMWVSLEPTRGGVELIADRLQGKACYDLWTTWTPSLAGLRAPAQALNTMTSELYQVAWISDPFQNRRWLFMQLISRGYSGD